MIGRDSNRKTGEPMPLYVVRHHHEADRCPARDPAMGAMLLDHLSERNAQQHGVAIQGEAVVDGAHTLYMIVEADGRATVNAVVEPFAIAGDVEIVPASRREAVV